MSEKTLTGLHVWYLTVTVRLPDGTDLPAAAQNVTDRLTDALWTDCIVYPGLCGLTITVPVEATGWARVPDYLNSLLYTARIAPARIIQVQAAQGAEVRREVDDAAQ